VTFVWRYGKVLRILNVRRKRAEDEIYPKWEKIREEGKFLRVILLPDEETVHNAFFDRSFKGEEK